MGGGEDAIAIRVATDDEGDGVGRSMLATTPQERVEAGAPARPTGERRTPTRLAWTVGGGTALVYAALALLRWLHRGAGVDLAIFTQGAQGYAHGGPPLAPIKSELPFNLLGDHFSPAAAVFAPVYRLLPHAWSLLLVQAALIGLTVALVTRAAALRLGVAVGASVGVVLACAWGIQAMALFDVHEVAIALPLVALAYLRLLEHRHRGAAAWAMSTMLVKEDSVFLVLGVALVLAARRRWRSAGALAAAGLAAFALIVGVVVPAISFYGRYTYWASAVGGANPLLAAARNVAHAFASGAAGWLLVALLAPTLGVAVRSPLLLGVLPPLAARLTSPQPSYWGPDFHYSATVTVIVVVAAVDVLPRLRLPRWSPWPLRGRRPVSFAGARVWAAGALAASLFVVAVGPVGRAALRALAECEGCLHIAKVLGHVPDGAVVAADDTIASYLVDRSTVLGLHPGFVDSTGRRLHPQFLAIDRAHADAKTEAWINHQFETSAQAQELGEAVLIDLTGRVHYDVIVFQVLRPLSD